MELVNQRNMDPNVYNAAVKGNMDAFKEKGSEEIERMLTPNRNTILHIHLTSYNVSEPFVQGILDMCPALLMKPNVKVEAIVHIAARYGHDKIVTKLVGIAKTRPEIEAKTMLIRAVDNKNNTALHEAVRFHHTEIVHILTMEDPHYSYFGNTDGETPLYMAVEREYGDVVIKILENCESTNQDGPNRRTALHAAIIRNNREMVSKLLEKSNSRVKDADENGWIPLHLAALNLSTDLTEMLLKYEMSTAYMRDKRGRTALHLAALCRNDKMIEKIIEYCPDCAELVDENGFNALHYVAHSPWSFTNSAEVIMKNESLRNLFNEKDYNGNTPLHHLVRFGLAVRQNPLLKPNKRVDTMAFNKKNQTAIDVAYENYLSSTSLSESKNVYLGNKLKEIGVRHGGRMIMMNKNERKMKQVEKKKKQEEINEDSAFDPFFTRLRETNFIVATLITTVTFAAGFTLPGGLIQEFDKPEKGSPILKHNHAFQAFVITNSVSFVLSASAVLLLFFSSNLAIGSLSKTFINIARVVTILAMAFLIIAFVTGTYAVLGAGSEALAVITLFIGLSFFFCFVVSWWVFRKFHIEFKDKQVPHFSKSDRAILRAKDIQFESVGSSAYPEP